MSAPPSSRPRCWCGGRQFERFSDDYLVCQACGTLVLEHPPAAEALCVVDDEKDFYGRSYYDNHLTGDYKYPTLAERARTDLTERCVHWLRTLLEYRTPPADVLEIGSGPGAFVALLQQAGYRATGLEVSPAVVEFTRRTFDVPMLLGPITEQRLPPASLDVLVLMDVLEHFPDPVGTLRHALKLLRDDGVLLFQTPRVPEGRTHAELKAAGDRFLEQLKAQEHIYLFSECSIRSFLERLGVGHVAFERPVFEHYDMFVVASRRPLARLALDVAAESLAARASTRFALALLDADGDRRRLASALMHAEEDRAARLGVIQAQGQSLGEIEGERNRLKAELEDLRGHFERAEADREARLHVIQNQGRQLSDMGAIAENHRQRAVALEEELGRARAALAAARAALDAERGASQILRTAVESGRGADAALHEAVRAEREAAAAVRQALESEREAAAAMRRALDTERESGEVVRAALDTERAAAESLRTALDAERQTVGELRVSVEAEREAAAALRDEVEAEKAKGESLALDLGSARERAGILGHALTQLQQRLAEFGGALEAERGRTESLEASRREIERSLDFERHRAASLDTAARELVRNLDEERHRVAEASAALSTFRNAAAAHSTSARSLVESFEQARSALVALSASRAYRLVRSAGRWTPLHEMIERVVNARTVEAVQATGAELGRLSALPLPRTVLAPPADSPASAPESAVVPATAAEPRPTNGVAPDDLANLADRLTIALARRPDAFEELERRGLHVTPVNFYSAIPNVTELASRPWPEALPMTGVEMREEEQLAFLQECRRFQEEYGAFPEKEPADGYGYYRDQPMFRAVDAEVLYCMVRRHRPRRVIEIGSGFSTRVTAAAMRANAAEGGAGELVAIEPYPSEALRRGFPGLTELRVQEIQSLPPTFADHLEANDILFIDSTHVVRTGSDVLFLFLEVLPRLQPGVIVHVHDIFLPAEYPRGWVVDEHRFWTEQYLLHAFLLFNGTFQVAWAGSYMHMRQPDAVRRAFPAYDPSRDWPGSFWMRRAMPA
jgi:SAM-dependent methyltransferase